jgi:hypothetical protein
MADNTVLNSGTGGDTIATDDIAGVKHQRVKIQYGTDGSATDVSDSNPLPIDDAGGSLTVDGTVTADAGTGPWPVTDNAGSLTVDAPTGTPVNVQIGNGTNQASVDTDGALRVDEPNVISTNNSTSTPLGISGNFTGTADDVSDFSAITVQIDASHDSSASGMTFEFSTDNSNWDDSYTFTYTASEGSRRFQFPVTAQYFRVNYTNGGTGQTHFRLQTINHRHPVTGSVHRLGDDTSADRSANVVKSVIMAQQAGTGDFTAVQSTASGNFKVALEEYDGVPVGGGVESGALRVTLANDSTGVLSVDDNGSSLTVDGTVTANLSAVDNAVLDQIDVNTNYGNKLGGGVEAGSLRVTLASDSTGLLSVDDNGSSLTVDNGGTFAVQSTLQTGSSLVGDVGLSGARTSGGTTLYKNIDVDETEDEIKGAAGQVYWIHAMNLSNAVRYLKLYNATAATVVVGTTVPDLTFPIPTQGDTNGAGFTLSIPNGIAFGTAITVAATTGVADNDASAPGANEIVVNLGYA